VLIVSTFPSGEERDLPPITYKKTVSAKLLYCRYGNIKCYYLENLLFLWIISCLPGPLDTIVIGASISCSMASI